MNRRQLGALTLALIAPRGAAAQSQATPQAESDVTLAIEHVTVVPMTGGPPIPDATVLIAGDRIVSIEPAMTATVPAGAERVDGAGQWLLPGLIDMHVHIVVLGDDELPYGPEESLLPFLANGVMQLVDLASSPETNRLRDEIAAGEIRAPRLATARMVDGDPPIRPEAATALRTSDEGRQAVAEISDAGFDFVKVYSWLDLDTYAAVLDEAQTRGIRVIGHLPGRDEAAIADVMLPGLGLVAHAEEFAFHNPDRSDAAIAEYVELARKHGIGLISTLFLDEQLLAQTRDPDMLAEVEGLAYVDPVTLPGWFEGNRNLALTDEERAERIELLESVIEFGRRLVAAFVEAGIPVLAGTDTIVPGVAPGFALHEELQALARAGLSNEQILTAATSAPAQWLGIEGDRGTVAPGQRANLLLLAADPLAEIGNTRQITAIVLDGALVKRAALDTLMSRVDATYTPLRPLFSPRAAEILENR